MSEHVLVVEDSRTQAQRLRGDLEDAGFRVTVATSGEEALERLRDEKPSLVLSDVVMPGMDGYDLCRAVKGDAHLGTTPVVLLTSLNDPLDVVRGLEAGADNFLRKPYDAEQLVDRIRSMLYNRSLRAAGKVQMGVEMFFLGRRFMITSERQQILDLLVSTFQDLVDTNRQLRAREEELAQAHEALKAARDEAMEASRLKSAFLANMSHEIRTPMNGVIGITSLLLESELPEEQREWVELIRKSGEALLALINDILDLSKIEAGKIELDRIDFDPRAAVEEAVELLGEQARAKGLLLTALVQPDVPTVVCGDPGRLRQVLLNLAGNAVKFTERGEVVVRLVLVEETDDEVVLRAEVEDTGPGISAHDQARLFRRFSQGDESDTRRHGGTGLGLAISRQLVALMRGEIGVESEVGEGSTFWFTVRLRKANGDATSVPTRRSQLAGVRVLVVDDDATNRTILERQLTSWGMRADSAGDAGEALRMLHAAAEKDDAYPLAILDLQMPGMNGMQLARAITHDPAITDVRLVLLTSTDEPPPDVAAANGFHAHLTKPVEPSALQRCLSTVVGLEESEAPGTVVTPNVLLEAEGRSRPRVLVAEDNVVNQKVAVGMLDRLGYRVDVVNNGVEAVAAVARNDYAAVLMDCQMPQMDGYEATAEIRRQPGGERIPIIALTAGAMPEDQGRALAAGMDAYLSKPVAMDVLDRVLRERIGAGSPPVASSPEPRRVDEANDGKLIAHLAPMFVEHAEVDLRRIREAAEQDEAATVGEIAHRLKGSSATFGATAMAATCGELEGLAREGDLAGVMPLLETLEQQFAEATRTLTAGMPEPGPAS